MRKTIHRRAYTKNAVCGRRGRRLAFAADGQAAIDCVDCMEKEAAREAEGHLLRWLTDQESANHDFNAGIVDRRDGMGDWLVQTCQRCGMWRHIDRDGYIHHAPYADFKPTPVCNPGAHLE